jgi:3-phenylpropionate/trans-cinnamate dioxygenase ferredoxin subunit
MKVARLEDIPADAPLGIETIDGDKICLIRLDGEVYAMEDRCSHRDFPLSNGHLDGDQLECAWHGARFDVRTGRPLSLPAIRPVRVYEVRVEEGDVYVAVD